MKFIFVLNTSVDLSTQYRTSMFMFSLNNCVYLSTPGLSVHNTNQLKNYFKTTVLSIRDEKLLKLVCAHYLLKL